MSGFEVNREYQFVRTVAGVPQRATFIRLGDGSACVEVNETTEEREKGSGLIDY